MAITLRLRIFPAAPAYIFTEGVVQMKQEIRKMIRSGICSLAIAAVCAGGIRLAGVRNAANAPDVQPAAAAQMPVIVLDAGHGEST